MPPNSNHEHITGRMICNFGNTNLGKSRHNPMYTRAFVSTCIRKIKAQSMILGDPIGDVGKLAQNQKRCSCTV